MKFQREMVNSSLDQIFATKGKIKIDELRVDLTFGTAAYKRCILYVVCLGRSPVNGTVENNSFSIFFAAAPQNVYAQFSTAALSMSYLPPLIFLLFHSPLCCPYFNTGQYFLFAYKLSKYVTNLSTIFSSRCTFFRPLSLPF